MMVKEQRIPASEIKGQRTFGGDSELIVTHIKGRPIPTSEIQNIRSFGADVQAAGVVITEGPRLGRAKK